MLNYIYSIIDHLVTCYLFFLPDKMYLTLKYRCLMGHWIPWKNPRSFTEKLQWLKIYDRNPKYTMMVDKFAVKEYVASVIGDEYVIPTLGVWDAPEDIDWDILPQKFVLKTTHSGGSTGVIICRDKSNFDRHTAIVKLRRSLDSDIFLSLREWPYKNVKKRIVAEELIQANHHENEMINDFKFFCFNGIPQFCQVIRGRGFNETINFYDMNWNQQEFVGLGSKCNKGVTLVECPANLNRVIEHCKLLSKDIPFVRVDIYLVDDREYFSELTFYPYSGLGKFTPDEWDYKLGRLISITGIKQ